MNNKKLAIIALSALFASGIQNAYSRQPTKKEAAKNFVSELEALFKSLKKGKYSKVKFVDYDDYQENSAAYTGKQTIIVFSTIPARQISLPQDVIGIACPENFILYPSLTSRVQKDKFLFFLPPQFIIAPTFTTGTENLENIIIVKDKDTFLEDIKEGACTSKNYYYYTKTQRGLVQTPAPEPKATSPTTSKTKTGTKKGKAVTSTPRLDNPEYTKFKERLLDLAHSIFGVKVKASNFPDSFDEYRRSKERTREQAFKGTITSGLALAKSLYHKDPGIEVVSLSEYQEAPEEYESVKQLILEISSNEEKVLSAKRNLVAVSYPENYIFDEKNTILKNPRITTILPVSFNVRSKLSAATTAKKPQRSSKNAKQTSTTTEKEVVIKVLDSSTFINDVKEGTCSSSNYEIGKNTIDENFKKQFPDIVKSIFGGSAKFFPRLDDFISERTTNQKDKKEKSEIFDPTKGSSLSLPLNSAPLSLSSSNGIFNSSGTIRVSSLEYQKNQTLYDGAQKLIIELQTNGDKISSLGTNVIAISYPNGYNFSRNNSFLKSQGITTILPKSFYLPYEQSVTVTSQKTSKSAKSTNKKNSQSSTTAKKQTVSVKVLDSSTFIDDVNKGTCTISNYTIGGKGADTTFSSHFVELVESIFGPAAALSSSINEFISEQTPKLPSQSKIINDEADDDEGKEDIDAVQDEKIDNLEGKVDSFLEELQGIKNALGNLQKKINKIKNI